MFSKDLSSFSNFGDAISLEWLETNGIGGWSSSSLPGCHTRRYHGVLVAATHPPTGRMALLSKLDETLVIDNNRFELGTNLYAGNTVSPTGYEYLHQFSKALFPQWEFRAGGIVLRKTVAMVHGENSVLILYEALDAPAEFALEFLPLISARDYHALQHVNNQINEAVQFENGMFCNRPFESAPTIYISIPGSTYQHHPQWYYHFDYAQENYRGLDHEEDLFNHGHFSVQLKKGSSLAVIVSTENPMGRNARQLLAKEKQRRQSMLDPLPEDTVFRALALAADQFIVARSIDLKTVIAGYHWFTDWGRDTMVSLPGLCLVTRRYDDAKKILQEFARVVSMGMLPNRFQDDTDAPEYNNADGTLWFFIAVHKYLEATGDEAFILKNMLPVLGDIISWHHQGTRYHIHVDEDGLLFAGEPGVQLTWMDAKVGDWVVTPRIGKAVEVNALWYNAQCIYADLLNRNGQQDERILVNKNIDLTRTSFQQAFWNNANGYLYDVVNGVHKDPTIRPNALFAVSLPYSLLDAEQGCQIIQTVEKKLLVGAAIRSLDREDPNYVGTYGGDQLHRDAAYHQGTAWTWLVGPYIDAMMRCMKKEDARERARAIVQEFSRHLSEAGVGSVSEILDGDAPFHARGCIAQAWGVGEWLRVMGEYRLIG